jgi:hypothetical protein
MRDQSGYNKKYYTANKDKEKQRARDRQKVNMAMIREHKLKIGCSRCGYKNSSSALHFHHLGNKANNISKMCSQGRSMDSIWTEIDKCICLCSNCHAEEHEHEVGMKPSVAHGD